MKAALLVVALVACGGASATAPRAPDPLADAVALVSTAYTADSVGAVARATYHGAAAAGVQVCAVVDPSGGTISGSWVGQAHMFQSCKIADGQGMASFSIPRYHSGNASIVVQDVTNDGTFIVSVAVDLNS